MKDRLRRAEIGAFFLSEHFGLQASAGEYTSLATLFITSLVWIWFLSKINLMAE